MIYGKNKKQWLYFRGFQMKTCHFRKKFSDQSGLIILTYLTFSKIDQFFNANETIISKEAENSFAPIAQKLWDIWKLFHFLSKKIDDFIITNMCIELSDTKKWKWVTYQNAKSYIFTLLKPFNTKTMNVETDDGRLFIENHVCLREFC